MSYSKLILRDSADIVWPLDDISPTASISKPINFFTTNEYSYSASINISNTNVSYNPIIFGGGTSLSFTSSAVGMSIPAMNRLSEIYNYRESSISLWFQSSVLFHEEYPIFKKRGFNNIGLFIKDNYIIFRYGTDNIYKEVSLDISDPTEPHHIFINKNSSNISLVIDGRPSETSLKEVELIKDSSHVENDYFDFYGPPSGEWKVDSIAYYPNSLNPNALKRHYVYGLGKSAGDEIFYSRGGNLYNFSTIDTNRVARFEWRFPQEWRVDDLYNLTIDRDGLKPNKFNTPNLFSYDQNISTDNDSISFKSASNTVASYIEIDNLYSKIQSGNYPFFIKLKLDGELPEKYLYQNILSMGQFPESKAVVFDLFNNGYNYQIRISSPGNSSSVTFDITSPESEPEVYVGMKFNGSSIFYFCQEGQSIQTSSFSYLSEDGFGLDPLTPYFPPPSESVLRIGSSLNFDSSTFTDNVYGVNQFYGTFIKFMVGQPELDETEDFTYLESYNKVRYQASYDSSLKRFKVKTFGSGAFNFHSINFSDYSSDDYINIGANSIKIGYPDVQSSSQVMFYTTLMSYSGSTVYPKTILSNENYLPFLNNTNLIDTYLKFDFEIYSEDSIFYPPKIKFFNLETFKSNDGLVLMRDPAGQNYTLYPSSSSVFLPESRQTPTIYLRDKSGLKLKNTIVDLTENILAKPLDPRIKNNLILWIDSRFVDGLNKINPVDNQAIYEWADLSQESNNLLQESLSDEPVFRLQSKNILTINQSNGSELGDLSNIIPINSLIESSTEGAVTGARGIKVTPDGSSNDSYISVMNNTVGIKFYPNQQYTFIGSLKLTKPQTSSALHDLSRKICIFINDGDSTFLSASSVLSTNSVGVYPLSLTFTTSSSFAYAEARLYNGSSQESDFVYWDNIGMFPSQSSSLSWSQPLLDNDRSSVMFNGNSFMTASLSLNNQFSTYILLRSFGDGKILSNSEDLLSIVSGSYTFSTGVPTPFYANNNKFNLFSLIHDNGSSSFYANSNFLGSYFTGTEQDTITEIGDQFKGDISCIVIYNEIHGINDRISVEEWISESFDFNVIH